jgi:hypothetical protein
LTTRPTTTTTTRRSWWQPPPSTTPRPWYRPEVIEAVQRTNSVYENYLSPASDVILKFKLFKMTSTERPPTTSRDDFVIVESATEAAYNPEVIEIKSSNYV